MDDLVRKTSQDSLPLLFHDYNEDCDGMSAFGSCERCGSNLYSEDDEHYCDQYSWWIENVTPEER